jgi:hypothetical protein
VPPALVCSPWLSIDDVTLCDPAEFVAGRFERALDAATDLLYLALGGQFSGPCIDVVRPCGSSGAVQWLDYPADSIGGSRPLLSGCGCTPDGGWCGCTGHSSVRLPNTPVVTVDEVLLDGVAVPETDYKIVDDAWVVRIDGGSWPCCQRPLASTEHGTFEVTYTWGAAVSPAIVLAVEVLACELATSWSGGDCRLPRRVTSIVRENVSMTTLDPFDFVDDGRFGLYEVDEVVQMFNPNRLDRPPAILSPENVAARTRRLR